MTNITARRMTLFMVLIVTGCRDGEDAGDAGGTCTPEDDVTFCARLGRNCGVVTELDTCGESRSANCGGCTNPETCGGVGIAGVCGSAVCSDDGWCWENPLPQGDTIFGLSATAADDVWAVGQFGGIHHWNGATMTTTLPPGDPQLTGIDCIEDDVFITGGNGALLHLRR